jgi:hypothetical protein
MLDWNTNLVVTITLSDSKGSQMLYNEAIAYNQANTTYSGDLYIYVEGIENPIIVNNISFFYASNQDYSNLTTISVISIDVSPEGRISIEAYADQVDSLLATSVIGITGEAEISIDGLVNQSATGQGQITINA